ncbi:PdaC/SigV domain-containing protein [Paenibacillus sp. MBLB4367]|uniref:PdaC/SigV domain-containing protein n=1 Tax=Paenibacillus sp. MBLB4367 TaxID=3384767 RepID=UPI0039080FF2
MKRSFKMFTLSIAGSCLIVSGTQLSFAEGSQQTDAIPYNVTAVPISAIVQQDEVQVSAKTVNEKTDEVSVDASIPVIAGLKDKKYEAELNDILERHAMKDVEGIKRQAKADAVKAKEAGLPVRPYELKISYEVKATGGAADAGMFSLKVTTYTYTGGANGMPRIDTYNVANRTEAKRIELSGLFGADYKKTIDYEIGKEIAKKPESYFQDGFKGISETQSFYIEKGSAVIVFGKYEIAPGSSGTPEFRMPIPASAANEGAVSVTSKTVKEETSQYIADLNIPVVSGLKDKRYEEQLNDILERNAMTGLDELKKQAEEDAAAAKESGYEFRPYSLTIGYEVNAGGGSADNGKFSLAVNSYVYTGGAHGMPAMSTYNVQNDAEAARITLGDLLGSGYKALVDDRVKQEMAQHPDDYFANDFAGIDEAQLFYIEDGEAVVVFSPYEIAPYAAGFPEFRFPLAGGGAGSTDAALKPAKVAVNGKELGAEDGAFYPEQSGKALVPLRVIAEALGYELTWNDEQKAVELSKGAQWTTVRVDKDEYAYNKMAPIALGAAPVIREDGRMFVPVAFFSDILKADVKVGADSIAIQAAGPAASNTQP